MNYTYGRFIYLLITASKKCYCYKLCYFLRFNLFIHSSAILNHLYSPIASPDEFAGATVEFSPGEPVEIIYKTGPNKERVKILIFVPRPITSRHTVVTWAFWSRSETTS